jgi:energy-coupling factor transporter ATP-binding protein EcfA2
MAYIESFKVEGLAGRDKVVERELDRRVNIFWGLNGAGKTTLLKILHSALNNNSSSLDRVPFKRAEVTIRSTTSMASFVRTIDASVFTDSDDDEVTYGPEDGNLSMWAQPESARRGWVTDVIRGPSTIETRLRPIRDSVRFRHAYLPISRVSQSRTTSVSNTLAASPQRQAIDDENLDKMFATQVRQTWQAYNNKSLLEIRDIQQQGLASILAVLFGGTSDQQEVETRPISASSAYLAVRRFLKGQGITLQVQREEFIRRYEGESDLLRVVAKIERVTRDVDAALRPQNEFQNIIESLYSGGKRLRFSSPLNNTRRTLGIESGDELVPLQSLSSGEKQLLQLLLEVLAADQHTVMIDEPELSMHVDWQQRLVASMQRVNPDCQLLLATHSPEVMADVDDRYVFQI